MPSLRRLYASASHLSSATTPGAALPAAARITSPTLSQPGRTRAAPARPNRLDPALRAPPYPIKASLLALAQPLSSPRA